MSSHVAGFGGWSLDPAAMTLIVTSGIHKILGTNEKTQLTNTEFLELCDGASGGTLNEAICACKETGKPFDLTLSITTSEGGARILRLIGEPQYDTGGNIILINGAIHDISDLSRAEANAQKRTEQLANTLNSITDCVCVLDKEMRFTYINLAAENLLGMPLAQISGRKIFDIFPVEPDRPLLTACEKTSTTQEKQSIEICHQASGTWISFHIYPRTDGLSIYFQNVTEKHLLQEKLQRAQRLEAVGQLTGGIAHDFNNLLTVISGNTEMLMDGLSESTAMHQCASATHMAATRGAELTSRLLAFSRKQSLAPQVLNLNEIISETRAILLPLLGEQIEFFHREASGVWPTEIDKGQFENAIINLCVNARDAMPEGGSLTIAMENVSLDESATNEDGETQAGDYVLVSVRDTGTGMDDDVLKRAFEPFFTTKDVGKGSGLGLSMVYGFARQSGGHVKVLSALGKGTEAQLYLPRSAQTLEATTTQINSNLRPTGSEKILVVEDDEMVRDFVAGQLEALGYNVSLATNGAEALHLIEYSGEFDLLFTDIVMPGKINGRQLVQAVRAKRPHMKVLFTTGYADGLFDEGHEPNVHVLSKPYRRDDLATKIRTALSSAS
ncbi:MAG: ATP-binding protein [Parvibaculaceae bacterium]